MKLSSVIVNSKESDGTRADPFWDHMTTQSLNSYISYGIEREVPNFNFHTLLEFNAMAERRGETKNSTFSRMMELHHKSHSNSWAYSQFQNVNTSPDKTYDSIRATLSAKFSALDTEELRIMMSKNELDFSMIGREKTAVFVVVSDTDRSMDTLANIFFTQAMQELCRYADEETENQRLPVPVRFILDDFATNCKIDEFPRMISSIRSRAISVMLMLQSESQLVQGYGCDAKTIIANCDTYAYLGGNDVETAKSISVRCDAPLRKILYMPIGTCWVFRRGFEPVNAQINDVNEPFRHLTDERTVE